MIFDYFDGIEEAIQFLLALGSAIGLLGLIVGILGWMFLGQFNRQKMIGVLVASVILLAVCGVYTGIEYFHLDINV
ncbi:MAG: hypothetical protein ACFFAQ_04055 [Promethearchaeota archaeon]